MIILGHMYILLWSIIDKITAVNTHMPTLLSLLWSIIDKSLFSCSSIFLVPSKTMTSKRQVTRKAQNQTVLIYGLIWKEIDVLTQTYYSLRSNLIRENKF